MSCSDAVRVRRSRRGFLRLETVGSSLVRSRSISAIMTAKGVRSSCAAFAANTVDREGRLEAANHRIKGVAEFPSTRRPDPRALVVRKILTGELSRSARDRAKRSQHTSGNEPSC